MLVLLALGAHKKRCDNDTFRVAFPIWYLGTPKYLLHRKLWRLGLWENLLLAL